MTKYEVLATIKNANAIVDEMSTLAVDSEQYDALNQDLGWVLDSLFEGRRWFTLHLSPKTGHYYVRF